MVDYLTKNVSRGNDGTYKELALEEVKNNVDLHNVSKKLLAEEFNNGYIRGCEDTEANYKANT